MATKKNEFAEARVDVAIPVGVCIQVDYDLRLRDGEKPTPKRLNATSDEAFVRWEERVMKALQKEFGERIHNVATGRAIVIDTATGAQRPVRASGKIPDLPDDAPAETESKPEPEPKTEPEFDAEDTETERDFSKMSKKALLELAREAGVHTPPKANKATIVQHLEENL